MATYNPAVTNQSGAIIGRGIESVGNSFGQALMQYGSNKRADAQRKENRQWEIADRDALWTRQDARDDKMWGREKQLRDEMKSEREAERQRKQQEEADAADGLLAGQIALYPGAFTPELAQVADRMPPKAKADFARTLAQYGAEQMREQRGKQFTGIEQTDQYQINGNNQIIPPKRAEPPQLTPEQIMSYGLQPESVNVGGVTYKKPEQPKPVVPPSRVVNDIIWERDPVSGKWVPAPGQGAAPGGTSSVFERINAKTGQQ